MTELRVSLKGEQARLGSVDAADVAQLILQVQKALARSASVVLNRPKTSTGRYEEVVARSVRLKLRAIQPGSIVADFEIPDFAPEEGETLDVEVAGLGVMAAEKLMAASDIDSQPHPVVAEALLELTRQVHVGDRYDAITFDSYSATGTQFARVDAVVRQKLDAYVRSAPAPVRPDAVAGTLVEADFEKNRARLRTPTEASVAVTFAPDQADDIHEALRHPASLRGEVVYDDRTGAAKSVSLNEIDRGEQLVLGANATEFWQHPTFADLAQAQGVTAVSSIADLHDADASDEERDAFLAALADG